MKTSEQLSSLFSHTDNESDYEEEKRKKKFISIYLLMVEMLSQHQLIVI